jgi:Protein of unknown function (DUF1501)
MKRREFCQILSASSMMLATPMGINRAFAAPPDRFLVMVAAAGAWDPTSFMDPKGNAVPYDKDRGVVNHYSPTEIKTAGGIRVAPNKSVSTDTDLNNVNLFYDFFNQPIISSDNGWLVVNGINSQTNNHGAGESGVWSGNLNMNDFPCLAALYAGCTMPMLPFAFSNFGFYSTTRNVVPKVEINNTSLIDTLANPNYINATTKFVEDDIFLGVEEARKNRLSRLKQRETLPEMKYQLGTIYVAEENLNQIKSFKSVLDSSQAIPTPFNKSDISSQARIACAAFKAGLAISANLSTTRRFGFDTHDDHDARHYTELAKLLLGIKYLIQEADRQGIADKLTIVVGSDFGRTPYYNEDNGKDHWSHTSMMFWGKGFRTGNRVVGETDHQFKSKKLDPVTLRPSTATNAIGLNYDNMHAALRKNLGIHTHMHSGKFPVKDQLPDLFS